MAGVPAAVKTTVTELPDSRVRVQVEVPPGEVEGRVEQRARQLGRQLKLPGFRKGKVPAPLVLQRVGREAVLDEAVRDSLASWYSDAIETAGHRPRGRSEGRSGGSAAAGAGARVLDRDRRAAEGRARRLRGPGGRAPRAGGRGGADPAGDRCDARAPGPPGDGRARGRQRATSSSSTTSATCPRRTDGLDPAAPRAAAVRGRRGPRPADRARRRQPDPRLRGGPTRIRRRGDAHDRAEVPRGLRRRAPCRPGRFV